MRASLATRRLLFFAVLPESFQFPSRVKTNQNNHLALAQNNNLTRQTASAVQTDTMSTTPAAGTNRRSVDDEDFEASMSKVDEVMKILSMMTSGDKTKEQMGVAFAER